jgi:hypothetical protein
MAYLQETSRWEEGIRQLEVDDPVQGGPEGIDNVQARQLGNRTLYLKKALEELGGSGSPPSDPVAHWSCDDLPEIPDDPAGQKYRNNREWTGFRASDGQGLSVSNGILGITGTNYINMSPNIAVSAGDIVIIRARQTTGSLSFFAVGGNTGSTNFSIDMGYATREWKTFIAVVPGNVVRFYSIFRADYTTVNATFEVSDIYTGSGAYLAPLIDNSGNGRHLDIGGGVLPKKGRFGNGIQFIRETCLKRADILNGHSGDFSVSVWTNKQSNILGKRGGSWSTGFGISRGQAYFISNNPNVERVTGQFTEDGSMHHFVLRVKDKMLALYIDGVLSGQTSIADIYNSPLDNVPLTIGALYPAGNFYADVDTILDEIAVFDRALSDGEIEALYRQPMPKKAIWHKNIITGDGSPVATEAHVNTAVAGANRHADTVDGTGRDLRLVFGIENTDPAEYIPLIMAELRRRCNNNGEIDNSGIPDFTGIETGDYVDGLDLSGVEAPLGSGGETLQAWNDTYKNNRLVVSGFNIYKGAGDTENAKNHVLFTFRNSLSRGCINDSNSTNSGGYPPSTLRAWLEGSAGDGTGILAMKLKEAFGGNYFYTLRLLRSRKSRNFWDNFTLFLPTEIEVFGCQSLGNELLDINTNVQFPIYQKSAVYRNKRYNGERYPWWTATPDNYSPEDFVNISFYGHVAGDVSTSGWGVSPVFCVA